MGITLYLNVGSAYRIWNISQSLFTARTPIITALTIQGRAQPERGASWPFGFLVSGNTHPAALS